MEKKLKFKGTPGPWKVSDIYDGWKDCVSARSVDDDVIAVAKTGNKETAEADARLIAAAPDMLEALLLFVEINNKDYSNGSLGLERDFIELETKVNKAIKKALEE